MSTYKRNASINSAVDIANQSLIINFAGESTPLVVALNEFSADIVLNLTLHGLKQKLLDGAAIARNPENGRSASISDKKSAVVTILEQLRAGCWNAKRQSFSDKSLLLQALCLTYPAKSRSDIEKTIENWSAKEISAMLDHELIAETVKTLRSAAISSSKIDVDKLLEQL